MAVAPARRGAPAKISRDQVVEVAMDLADSSGLEALTARRLALKLGVAAPTLYGHFGSMHELQDVVVARILDRATEGLRWPRRWDQALPLFARRLLRVLREHPSYVEVARRQPISNEAALQAVNALVGALMRAGLTPGQAA